MDDSESNKETKSNSRDFKQKDVKIIKQSLDNCSRVNLKGLMEQINDVNIAV